VVWGESEVAPLENSHGMQVFFTVFDIGDALRAVVLLLHAYSLEKSACG
jgi:hypothetical protein